MRATQYFVVQYVANEWYNFVWSLAQLFTVVSLEELEDVSVEPCYINVSRQKKRWNYQ